MTGDYAIILNKQFLETDTYYTGTSNSNNIIIDHHTPNTILLILLQI